MILDKNRSFLFSSIEDSHSSLYAINIRNKNEVETNEVSMEILKPEELSIFVRELLNDHKDLIKIFIRPSGTENTLRVFIEGMSLDAVDSIKHKINNFIFRNLK